MQANQCSFGETYRKAKRGGQYIATVADIPQPSIYVSLRKVAGCCCQYVWCSVYSTELPMQTVTLRLLCLATPCKPAAQQTARGLLLVSAPVSSHPWALGMTLLVWTLVAQLQAATSYGWARPHASGSLQRELQLTQCSKSYMTERRLLSNIEKSCLTTSLSPCCGH